MKKITLIILQYPLPIIKKAWELGLMNGHISQEYGMLESCLSTISKLLLRYIMLNSLFVVGHAEPDTTSLTLTVCK